jgi:hypothetical protein
MIRKKHADNLKRIAQKPELGMHEYTKMQRLPLTSSFVYSRHPE